jgi:hypothetical protein
MHDHDQRFKTLIREFFSEFLELFFADWAKRLDCSKVEWLDKEVFPDPPEGDRNVLDLVGKLPVRQEIPGYAPDENQTWLALVHIEIESPDKATPLRPRMYDYYTALRKRYGLPVLPIAIFLKVGLNGISTDVYEEHFWELRPIRFEYLYVGLPALPAVEYLEKDNWLGWALSALMKIPKEKLIELGAEALRRIAGTSLSDQKKFLLGECVHAYLPMDPAEKAELMKLLVTERYSGVQAMNKTIFEEKYEEGVRDTIRENIEDRFGALPVAAKERLNEMSLPELKALRKKILQANSLTDLGLDG